MKRALLVLALTLTACSHGAGTILYEDGSYILRDGFLGCVVGALCDDSAEETAP